MSPDGQTIGANKAPKNTKRAKKSKKKASHINTNRSLQQTQLEIDELEATAAAAERRRKRRAERAAEREKLDTELLVARRLSMKADMDSNEDIKDEPVTSKTCEQRSEDVTVVRHATTKTSDFKVVNSARSPLSRSAERAKFVNGQVVFAEDVDDVDGLSRLPVDMHVPANFDEATSSDAEEVAAPVLAGESNDESDLLCSDCGLAIEGSGIFALRRFFHAECFSCSRCNNSLKTNARKHAGLLYCLQCFDVCFARTCDQCKEIIRGVALSAGGTLFHSQCFLCTFCKMLVVGAFSKEPDGSIMCTACVEKADVKIGR